LETKLKLLVIQFLERFYTDLLTWEEVINNLNQSIQKNEIIKYNKEGFYVSHSAHLIPKVKKLLNKTNCKEAHLYINFISNKTGFGKHKDSMDVWFWQTIGQTQWNIEGSFYLLNPGDLIHIPKETYHEVIPTTARVGISMSK
jgi:ribosomal protein L16 Arg81 hydroxylase